MSLDPRCNALARQLDLAATYARDGALKTAIEIAMKAVFGRSDDWEACQFVMGAVVTERARQVRELGYDAAHDDEHVRGEIAVAAALFALPPAVLQENVLNQSLMDSPPMLEDLLVQQTWPVRQECADGDFDLQGMAAIYQRLNDLTKAGALILAEMQRLARLGAGIKPRLAEGGGS
jgi:hypothetical protein